MVSIVNRQRSRVLVRIACGVLVVTAALLPPAGVARADPPPPAGAAPGTPSPPWWDTPSFRAECAWLQRRYPQLRIVTGEAARAYFAAEAPHAHGRYVHRTTTIYIHPDAQGPRVFNHEFAHFYGFLRGRQGATGALEEIRVLETEIASSGFRRASHSWRLAVIDYYLENLSEAGLEVPDHLASTVEQYRRDVGTWRNAWRETANRGTPPEESVRAPRSVSAGAVTMGGMLGGALGGGVATEVARAAGATPDQADVAGAVGGWLGGGAGMWMAGAPLGGALSATGIGIPIAIATNQAIRQANRDHMDVLGRYQVFTDQMARAHHRTIHGPTDIRVETHTGGTLTIPRHIRVRDQLLEQYHEGVELLVARALVLRGEMQGGRRPSPISVRRFQDALRIANDRLRMLRLGIEGAEEEYRREHGIDW